MGGGDQELKAGGICMSISACNSSLANLFFWVKDGKVGEIHT